MSILRSQMKTTHDLLEQAVGDLSPDHLHHRAGGSTINSIAAIYAHIVIDEDGLINGYVRKQSTLFEQGGWAEKISLDHEQVAGLSEAADSAARELNFDALREYAQQVYAATDSYLASLTEADLDPTIPFGSMGDMPIGWFLANVVSWHATEHLGEICALKGSLGGQGLPF